jgi:hypothetical protein
MNKRSSYQTKTKALLVGLFDYDFKPIKITKRVIQIKAKKRTKVHNLNSDGNFQTSYGQTKFKMLSNSLNSNQLTVLFLPLDPEH